MTKIRRPPITAAELTAKLQADPEFTARKQERDRVHAEIVARHRAEQAPIVADLRESGLKVERLSDMLPMTTPYPKAIPVLLRHLLLPYSDATRATIARIMAVPDSSYAWPILVAEYRKAPTGPTPEGSRLGAKDGLACAVSAATTDATMEELIDLAKDRSQGSSRVLLLRALKKSKSALAKQALEELATDPELAKEIASWKKKKKK